MTQRSVLVLGAGGMLGHVVAAAMATENDFDVVATTRTGVASLAVPGVTWRAFDASRDDIQLLLDDLPALRWVVNAIGVIKPFIGDDLASRRRAIDVNADFPHRLLASAGPRGIRTIQPATDGVYSGAHGPYSESSTHDPSDVYGMTKSLGEVPSEAVMHLRASIIGPELGPPASLLSWLLSQPQGAELVGYDNQRWNGVTSLEFARVTAGIIRSGLFARGVCHLVPADDMTKGALLLEAARAFGRDDLLVRMAPAADAIDRRLTTSDPDRNRALWKAAGHAHPPTICAMLTDLSRFTHSARPAVPPKESTHLS